MHDPRHLLDETTDAARKLARRGYTLDIERLGSLTSARSTSIGQLEVARAKSKKLAAAVNAAARAGEPTESIAAEARALKAEIAHWEQAVDGAEAELRELLLEIPNLPEDRAADGDSDEFAVEIRREGTPPAFDFTPRDHVDLGEALGILDFATATRLSGPRFAILKGAGAALQRALGQFFLDLHTRRHGYTEHAVPSLVTRTAMTGTGQLPKFEQDLFSTGVGDRELFLIPTGEVPLTNMFAGTPIHERDLPYAVTAQTPCYRSEAGSYGRDTCGLIRLHEFSKVELVRVCRPEDSTKELEMMLGHAETCLRELGLAYRVVALPAGDLGFAARYTYDIEVWVPSQNRYREISSVSDCGTFQARRAGIRYTTPTANVSTPRRSTALASRSAVPSSRSWSNTNGPTVPSPCPQPYAPTSTALRRSSEASASRYLEARFTSQRWRRSRRADQTRQPGRQPLGPVVKKDMRCSGSIIRSKHKMLVATAGHCVHTGKGGKWVQNLAFIPGFDMKGAQEVCPYGTFPAEKVRAMNGWIKRGTQGRDVAFFRVAKSDTGKGLEAEAGAQGYVFGGKRFKVKVTSIGYPASHKWNGNAQQKKCADETRRSGEWKQLRIDCDLTRGASGGPWLRDLDDGYGRIMSINSNMPKAEKEVDGPQFDLAVRAMYRKID